MKEGDLANKRNNVRCVTLFRRLLPGECRELKRVLQGAMASVYKGKDTRKMKTRADGNQRAGFFCIYSGPGVQYDNLNQEKSMNFTGTDDYVATDELQLAVNAAPIAEALLIKESLAQVRLCWQSRLPSHWICL